MKIENKRRTITEYERKREEQNAKRAERGLDPLGPSEVERRATASIDRLRKKRSDYAAPTENKKRGGYIRRAKAMRRKRRR
mgnify:FL=1